MTTKQKAMRLVKHMDAIKLKPRVLFGLSFSDTKTGKRGETKSVRLSFCTTLWRAMLWMVSILAVMKSASMLSQMKKRRACKKKLCRKLKDAKAKSRHKAKSMWRWMQ